ncbi:MAG: MFS transporter [Magnetococcales bacterium]|nr:MFS transporter [Magnetococcales bacterium]MBF0347117.1 MFS transporter [Magnetococcales bacterium]
MNSYVTLAGFYTFYFATLGIWMPYWPLYMSHVGHGPAAIGVVTSLSMAIKLLGPPVWGRLADRSDSRRNIIVATSLGGLLSSGLFLLDSRFFLLATAVALLHFFHVGSIALVETTAMETVTRHHWDYGRIRLWGSGGFILLALGLGPLTDRWGLWLVPLALSFFLLLQTLIATRLPDSEQHHHHHSPCAPPRLFHPESVFWFNLMGLLMQLSHGAYYGFMSLHLEQHGFSKTAIGILWSLGVLAEIAILAASNFILHRFGVSRVLIGSLLLAAVRWSIYSQTLDWPLLILGQLLHAFTFGTFHIAAIRRVFETSHPRYRATAQSWFSSISYGAGLGLGLLLSGWLFDRIGAQSLFALMAGVALGGMIAAIRHARLFDQGHPHD